MMNMLNMMTNLAVDDTINQMVGIINGIAIAVLSLITVGVVGLAIYIGFKMATASDDSKRKDAKRQLIFAVLGVVAIVVVIVLWSNVVMPFISSALQS